MSSKWIAVAAAALLLSVGAARSASAASCLSGPVCTADFNDLATQTRGDGFDYQRLHFTGMQFAFLPPVFNGVPYTESDMETAGDPMVITGLNGRLFDLLSFKIGLGYWNGSSSDSVTISGVKGNCTTLCNVEPFVVTVTDTMTAKTLPSYFSGLSSISFGQHVLTGTTTPDVGWLAYDDISYKAVPEPATWAMMLVGFGGLGAVLRRNRRRGWALAA